MTKDTKQPPFKRGEWVKGWTRIERVHKVRWCHQVSNWLVFTDHGSAWLEVFRLATARELRAESKRLAKRAAELSAAADAVEAKKAGKR